MRQRLRAERGRESYSRRWARRSELHEVDDFFETIHAHGVSSTAIYVFEKSRLYFKRCPCCVDRP